MKIRYAKKPLFLVLGALGILMVHLFTDSNNSQKVQVFRKKFQESVESDAEEKPTQPAKVNSYVYSWPKCERNMSAVNISGFSSLPEHIQNFLYYRHCRHFPMLLDIPNKCGGPEKSSEVFLLLVIKSSPGNYERREVLRKTWAEERQHDGLWIRRIFISGTAGEDQQRKRFDRLLQVEHKLYRDILQWDFADSFFNLTLKQILFLEWAERNCPNVRFLMNGDDDVFAHTNNMVEYLHSLQDNDGSKHLFTGHLIHYVGPIRSPGSKYYVPVQVEESNSYPPYCGGGGFLLSGYTASVIYNMSKSIVLLPIDDVYMGMCLAKAGLGPEAHPLVRTAGFHIPSKEDAYDPCFYRHVLLVHQFHPMHMFLMWNQVLNPNLKCSNSFEILT
ncbi:N-acetyllactosaminide beta-1,3-N-acetylglucosaminyltransferase 3-like [Boleophthalmus pectinirostris]|uniref:N-acetyllactosaminide beta-1,3-N-acetylglucosaminyltransferase 3-like n=1 Tax=Boleophthalmus pectinirostris TaxID=150288 RepID=UPI00242D539D|nr:N-acetyllactosaminide beta-1,3-N-acetylglucosaminyltransferase 3-like [Boleophthalmus pectinirostris]